MMDGISSSGCPRGSTISLQSNTIGERDFLDQDLHVTRLVERSFGSHKL
jgi:hypothetical protein